MFVYQACNKLGISFLSGREVDVFDQVRYSYLCWIVHIPASPGAKLYFLCVVPVILAAVLPFLLAIHLKNLRDTGR